MFHNIKDWTINAISNGGAVLVIIGILFAGMIGEITQPVSKITGWPHGNGAVFSPVDVTLAQYQCIDDTWTRNAGYIADAGSTYVTCVKDGIVIRYFENPPVGVEREQAMDTNVYPHVEISVEQAKQR